MYRHHQQTIDRLRDRFLCDPEMLALIVIGSVARGDAHERSDVDCYLVATAAEYQRRREIGQLSFSANELAEYPDGQANLGVVNLQFLHDVVARGPEPARFAFVNAIISFARVPGLDQLIAEIPCYPQHERHAKMTSFVSQLPVHLSYMHLADYSQNPYLLAETSVELVLYGGRLVLAHNRKLFRGRKLFLRELEGCPEKPPGMLDLARELLQHPGIPTATAFCDS